MEYKYLDSSININDEIILPESDKINNFLLKNHYAEAIKAIDFLGSEGQLLYIHGFLGTGKRQFINYVSEFLSKDVIKLEYYCKPSTVCDDILLNFIDIIEKKSISQAVSHMAKVTTLNVKFQQYLSSIKKPFVIILHSYDDIEDGNIKLISDCMTASLQNSNVKIILSTRAMLQTIFDNCKIDKKLFLKAFSKEIFMEFINSYKLNGTEDAFNDFYKYSRGYYYYTELAIKIMREQKISLNDFLAKFSMSGMSFDSYLGFTYINMMPSAMRNFFWFLRTIRHGISINALAVLGLYDDFSIEYLKNNLMIYQAGENIYVQEYFHQDIDISIPQKTEIKLHKYIIGIYEKELKESLQTRSILMSRQSLRAEIEYHNNQITILENAKSADNKQNISPQNSVKHTESTESSTHTEKDDINKKLNRAKKLAEEKRVTEAIEAYQKIIDEENPNINTLTEIRIVLGQLYHSANELKKSQHYYELAEEYYKQRDEYINLNYLYYELTQLYFDMYKIDRAIETIKKVIYSVDTPQSLMVDACTLLGNIYSETKNYNEASKYYQKALESIDENTSEEGLAELYFKFALMCDENEDNKKAFEYYNKCISLNLNTPYKALAYSNMGACYYESDNISDAEDCFQKAYSLEKENNNYEGIYYTASYLAKIYSVTHSDKVLQFLTEAKQCAEFINEDFCMLEATIAMGDYYYNHKEYTKNALVEYLKALKIARNYGDVVDLNKIDERIHDMKLRMDKSEYEKIEREYE